MRQIPASDVVDPQTWHTVIPDGEAGALQTVDYIRQLILESAGDFVVRQEALNASRNVRERDTTGFINAIHEWVKRRYIFRWDPYHREMLLSTRAIILNNRRVPGFGMDCDDFVILENSLLRAIGIPTRLVIAKCDRERSNQYSHIYLQAFDRKKKRWLDLDPTNKRARAGWKPTSFGTAVIEIDYRTGSVPESPVMDGQYAKLSRRSLMGKYPWGLSGGPRMHR